MKEVSTVDARNQFSTIINRAAFGKERIILTRRGKGIVVVVPIEDIDILEKNSNMDSKPKAQKEKYKKDRKTP